MHWNNLQIRMMKYSIFLMAHLTMAGLLTGFLSNSEVIASLYTLILITILQGIDDSTQFSNTLIISSNKNLTTKRILQSRQRQPAQSLQKIQAEDLSRNQLQAKKESIESETEATGSKKEATGQPKSIKERSERSNLYIERWKNHNLNFLPSFPLDRLAYLNSMSSDCNIKHFFFLRNTQLKQLSKKQVPQCSLLRFDDYHPKKFITDLFAIYVHRRSHFFRCRKVWAVDKRQFTMNYLLREKLSRVPDICADNLVYVGKGPYSADGLFETSSEESIAELDTKDRSARRNESNKKSVKEGIKEKFNSVVSSAVSSMKQKNWNFSTAKNSDEANDTEKLPLDNHEN